MIVSVFRYLLIGLVCITSLAATYLTFQIQSFDLYEENPPNTCEIDASCKQLHSCLNGTCHRFFPAQPANKTKCHHQCLKDLKLYEEKYYRQEIDNIIFFKGIDSEHCLIGYKQTGPRFSSENETYPKPYWRENIKKREILKNWILGLCVIETFSIQPLIQPPK
jgi:hypothetical protein